MGFLRRMFGGAGPTQELTITFFRRVRDDATLDLVGEAYRQENVAHAKPPSATDLPPGLPAPPAGYFKAVLVPEPTNKYNANAIRVALWAGRSWAVSGYLSREAAAAYQPLFRHLGRDAGPPPAVACDAALTRERGAVGVVLHLGTPGECMVELITDDRSPAAHPWAGQLVVFTGQSRTTISGALVDRGAQIMIARWVGCEVLSRITKKAQLLIVADPNDFTGNLQKARDYGIPVVQEPDFLRTVGIPPEAVGRDEIRWARV